MNEVGSRVFDDNDVEIASRGRRAGRRWRSRTRGSPTSARGSPTRSSASCCRRACRGCPAGRWRRCTSRPARSTRSAATSTRSSRSSGGWAVVLGDVSGKGAAAAAVTAEARHTIRTAGTLVADPVAGLHLLDSALRGRDDVALCSVAMVVLPDAPAATRRGARLPRRPSAPDPAPRRPRRAGRRARAAAGGRRRADLDPVRGQDRARRPARALHRRGDRGTRRRRRALRQRPPARRARRLRGARSSRSSGCAGRSRRSAPTLATTTRPWSRSGASRPSAELSVRLEAGALPAASARPDGARARPPTTAGRTSSCSRGVGDRARLDRARRRSPARRTWRSSR